jgi:hypothetical protein
MPAAEKDTVWATIHATLDRLFLFPEDIAAADKVPTLTPAEWSATYTAVWTWSTSKAGSELNARIDEYLAQLCTSLYALLMNAPQDRRLDTYAALYRGFARRAAVLGRLAAYLERHDITRARDEGKGWLRNPFPDVSAQIPQGHIWRDEHGNMCQEAVSVPEHLRDSDQKHFHWRENIAQHARHALVTGWELPPDSPQESIAWKDALGRAEAGSDPGQVASVGARALGLRRWRLGVLQPLLQDSPSLYSNEDGSLLEQLATSMKDVGIKVYDERRQQVARAMEKVSDVPG